MNFFQLLNKINDLKRKYRKLERIKYKIVNKERSAKYNDICQKIKSKFVKKI